MIAPNRFKSKLQSFAREHPDYMSDFDDFWKWKLGTENESAYVLDNDHREETFHRLCDILPERQTYRGVPRIRWREILEDLLERISDAYNELRGYSLLEFNGVLDELLELIWHELGRVKEYGGNRNSYGYYYVISVCKPLMLLWGQTLALDKNVRANVPTRFNIRRTNRWSFEEWKKVTERFQQDLQRNPEIVDFFKEESLIRYGTDSIVPYGRFLDIYYF